MTDHVYRDWPGTRGRTEADTTLVYINMACLPFITDLDTGETRIHRKGDPFPDDYDMECAEPLFPGSEEVPDANRIVRDREKLMGGWS